MAINLLSIQPHKVSRDLSGYITFLYGPPKCGKTTFGSRMPGHLILAFERGYNALPGAMIQDVTTWGEMKQIVRELTLAAMKTRQDEYKASKGTAPAKATVPANSSFNF